MAYIVNGIQNAQHRNCSLARVCVCVGWTTDTYSGLIRSHTANIRYNVAQNGKKTELISTPLLLFRLFALLSVLGGSGVARLFRLIDSAAIEWGCHLGRHLLKYAAYECIVTD